MAKIRIAKWFIEKNGINADAETWYEIKGSTEKAYRTEIGWIPKKCTAGYDDSIEASVLKDEEYKKSIHKGERKYYLKESWVFNLEAMNDKLYLIASDAKDEEYPMTIGGYVCRNAEDVWNVREWACILHEYGFGRPVTGKEYGVIRRIVEWRVEQRYFTCMCAGGLSEKYAGECFNDL